jgi:hypothetical protein
MALQHVKRCSRSLSPEEYQINLHKGPFSYFKWEKRIRVGKELTILSRGLGRQLLQIVFQNSLLQQ